MRFLFFSSSALLLIGSAYADDAGSVRELITCNPAPHLAQITEKFDDVKLEHRRVVDAKVSMVLTPLDNGPLPERLFLRRENAEGTLADTDLPLDQDGEVDNLLPFGPFTEDTMMCAEDPERVGQARDKDTMSGSMAVGVFFKDVPGQHSLTELKQGAKDAKSFYKLLSGAPGFLIPKLKHVTLTYEDATTPLQIQAVKNGQPLEAIEAVPVLDKHVISLEMLDDLGADTLIIEGGPYRLSPSLSPERVEKMLSKN